MVYFQPHIDTKVNKLQKKFTHLTVLVAPLDWGLGHTTRCIPIINSLLAQGCKVILAGERAQTTLFEREFPQIEIVALQGYRIQYAKKGYLFSLKLALQIPGIVKIIRFEHKWLRQVVIDKKVDLVISDNRYGLYHSNIPTIIITHQLQLHLGNRSIEKITQFFLYKWINRFTSCWVPDMIDGIAGKLSHPDILPQIPVTYINLLSRFNEIDTTTKYKYCFLISGPEPQRTIFEKKIFELVADLQEEVVVVRGLPNRVDTSYEIRDSSCYENEYDARNPQPASRNSHLIYPHLPTKQLAELVQQSEYIICRGGYTSLMELLVLRKKLIVVPTPGQTEQEYLAQTLTQQKQVYATTQNTFDKHTLVAASSFNYSFKQLAVFKQEDVVGLLSAIYDNNKISL